MKPFQERLEALLKKLAKRKEVRLGEIINILPEIKSNKKKLIKVSDLLNELGCCSALGVSGKKQERL